MRHTTCLLAAWLTVLTGCGAQTESSSSPFIDDTITSPPQGDQSPIDDGDEPLATCTYVSAFTGSTECLEYEGSSWTDETVRADCADRADANFAMGVCDMAEALGACTVDAGLPTQARTVILGTDAEQCAASALGCQQFAGGRFAAAERCADMELPELESPDETTTVPIFTPPVLICSPPVDERPGMGMDGEVCTWESIGGCTEEGRRFADYAECDSVMTQRPFVPVPPSTFKTDAGDPLMVDEAFLEEVEWVKQQAESCGCVCCHTTGIAPRGPAAFDTAAEGIWTDTFTVRGLAIAAGWIDSSPLGAHAAMTNNGFDRMQTGLPTTDVARMVRFFEGELARRGASRDEFEGASAVGGPLATQVLYEPEACEAGTGVSSDGRVHWSGGDARYVYVLDAGAPNPGVPPNLDQPDGTLWKLDVDYDAAALSSGIAYGVVPEGASQAVPAEGQPQALLPGQRYYLYVLTDISLPLERCLFDFPDVDESDSTRSASNDWGSPCASDTDCVGPTDYCVKMPGAANGYCSIHCNANAECVGAGVPDSWSCNAVNCAIEAFTWCGPTTEIDESGGFLSICE